MMKKTISIIFFSILVIVSISMGLRAYESKEFDDNHHENDDYIEMDHLSSSWFKSREDVIPVKNQTYQDECGDCHFAYQPGLLKSTDWQQIMNSLSDHYGDDASLDESIVKEIEDYLTQNSADHSKSSRSGTFSRSDQLASPLPRITQTKYFIHEHDEIPERLVKQNDLVRSFSNCQACHVDADSGNYNEHRVIIPGFGRWDD